MRAADVDADEGEVGLRGEDVGLAAEGGAVGAVDAEAGEERRGAEAEGDLDVLAVGCSGDRRGGVLDGVEIGDQLEEHPVVVGGPHGRGTRRRRRCGKEVYWAAF